MMEINKKDLIRFIGDELYRQYQRKVITVLPEYDTSLVREDSNLKDLIFEFFVEPYKKLLAYKRKLEEAKEHRFTEWVIFNNRYPNIEHEFKYVLSLINSLIIEYIKIRQEGEKKRELMSSVILDKELREKLQSEIAASSRSGKDGR